MTVDPALRILHADDGPQRAEWTELLDGAPSVEPFAHPAYLELFSSDFDRPHCAVMTIDDAVVIYPFVLRSLRSLPDIPSSLMEHSDICAPPYGWGGPWIIGTCERDEALSRFYSAFGEWAASAGVVSGYHTFDPTVETSEARYPGSVTAKLPVVVRNLEIADDALWRDYAQKVRQNVNRARTNLLTVEFDEDGHELETFIEIFYETMARVNAASRWYFSRSFFEDLVSGLPGRFVFVHVRSGDQIVSTELDLLSERCVYSFLGGTRADSFPLRPNDLLKHELICWARSRGAQSLVLGGGVSGEDSLFRYKRSFAPSGVRHLMTGRWVIDNGVYDSLVSIRDQRATGERDDFFPAYRAP